MTTAIVVGSGPNGLAAALTLASEGIEVTVLEAADTLGGGTRTSELTVPGLLHDECSAAHPLAVDTAFTRRFDLGAHGLTWRWPEVQYAHPLDGGAGAAAYQSVQATADGLGHDGRRWQSVFGPLAERFHDITADFMRPMLHVPEHPIDLTRFGLYSALPAAVLARRWSTEEARALFAGVAAHAFRPFGSPMSSAIGVTLGTAAHRYGWPVAEGGSCSISRAMIALLEDAGARFETGVRVESLAELGSADIVMLDVAPAAAARIAGDRMPRRIARALTRYRHGPGTFKVDYAIEGGVPWAYEPRAAGRHRARRRAPRGNRRRREAPPRRADARSAVRARVPAVPRRSVALERRRASRVLVRPRPRRLHRRRHRADRGPDRTLRPRVPRPDPRPTRAVGRADGGTQRQLRRRRRRHRQQRPAARWCSARGSRSTRTAPGSAACTSAPRPRHPAPAPTACAATTPHCRRCGGSTTTVTRRLQRPEVARCASGRGRLAGMPSRMA